MPKKDSKSIIASGKLQDELLALKLGVERSDQAIFITDKEGVILYVNPAFEELYGFSAEEVLGQQPRILKSGKEPMEVYKKFWDDLLDGKIVNIELINKTKDGRFLNIKASANPIINGDNEMLGFLSIQSDITERIEVHKKLIEAERNYRDIVDNSPDMIHFVDKDGHIIFANKKECEILGYKPGGLVGKHIYDIYSKELSETVKNGFKKLKEDGKLYVPDGKMIRKDGKEIDVEIDSITIKDEKGGFIRTRSIIRDVTERKKSKEALLASEAKFRNLMDHIPDVSIQGYDTDGKVLYWNKASEKVYGYTEKEAIGKNLGDLIIPDDIKPLFKEALENGKSIKKSGEFLPSAEVELLHKSGKKVSVYSIHTAVVTGKEKPMLFCIDVDLSERRNTERILKESEEKYRAFFEQAMDGIVIVDADTAKLVDFNEMAYKNLGYSHDEFAKLAISDLEAVESESDVRDHIKDMIKKGSDKFETKHKTKKGELKDILVSIRIICLAGKNYIYSIFHDITEQKNAQTKLLKEQERYKILFESSRDAIMTLEPPEWRFTSGNPETVKMFACDDEKDFTSHAPWQFSPQEQPDGEPSDLKAKEMILKAMETGSNYFEWIHRRKNGEDFLATVLLTRMTVEDKTFLQATVRDITEQKQAQEELTKKIQQMEFMGRVNLKRYKKMLEMQKEIIILKKRLGEEDTPPEDLDEFMEEA